MHFHQNPKLRPAEITQPSAEPASPDRKLVAVEWLRRVLRLGGIVALYGATIALGALFGWWAAAR